MIQEAFYSVNLVKPNNEFVRFIDGIFYLEHGSEFKIVICNNSSEHRINAKIYIDGKRIGYFRIGKNNKIVVERPDDENKQRKLTFCALDSKEGKAGNLQDSDKLGQLLVKIEREIERPKKCYFSSDEDFDCCNFSMHSDSFSGSGSVMALGGHKFTPANKKGGTVLGNKSTQKFSTAEYMEISHEIIHLEAKMMLLVKDEPIIPL